MPDTLEVRIAHLEGAYEQIDKRLGGVESGLSQLRQEIRQEMQQLRQQSQEQFRWLLGFQVLTWITITGAVLAFVLRR